MMPAIECIVVGLIRLRTLFGEIATIGCITMTRSTTTGGTATRTAIAVVEIEALVVVEGVEAGATAETGDGHDGHGRRAEPCAARARCFATPAHNRAGRRQKSEDQFPVLGKFLPRLATARIGRTAPFPAPVDTRPEMRNRDDRESQTDPSRESPRLSQSQ